MIQPMKISRKFSFIHLKVLAFETAHFDEFWNGESYMKLQKVVKVDSKKQTFYFKLVHD